ncbi:MAG: GldG family protein [Firmicutes bacterium]|nr:GldG family protein [Bacillota bacterium]
MKNQTKSLRLGGYSVLASAIVIAIAVAVNLFAGAIPAKYTRFDTSAKELYTLGDTTMKVLQNLDQDVEILWLVSDGSEDKTVQLLLDEYVSGSKHIKLRKQDPDINPALIAQYTGTFRENSLLVKAGDRDRFVDFYDIYTVEYDPNTYMYTGDYSINFSGENAITGAINYVTNAELPKVYALKGHGEAELSTNLNADVKLANVEIAELNLMGSDRVPEDADAVFIFDPQSDLNDEERTKLENYLAMGGNLLLITGVQEDGKALESFNKLMEPYGVTAVDGMVIDQNSGNYASGLPYNLLPDIVTNTITLPVKNNNYRVLMPYAQGLQVETLGDTTILTNKLFRTSNSAYSKVAGYNMQTFEKEAGDIEGGFALGVAITKTLSEELQIYSKMVWYTTPYLLNEDVSKSVGGANETIFINTLAWLCDSEEGGVVISAKSMADETLNMSASTVNILTVVFVGVIPLAYLAIGIIVWVRRRHR